MLCSLCYRETGHITYRTGDAVICNDCASKLPLSMLFSVCVINNINPGFTREIADEVEGIVVGLAGQTDDVHPQYMADYLTLSDDDYVSKYCDDPEALDYYQRMEDVGKATEE